MRTNENLLKEIKQLELKFKTNKDKNIEKSLAKFKMGLYVRYNSPLEVILFILLGFCFGIKNKRE